MKLVIVGGVAAGASTAARARRLSEEAEITVVEKGPDVSFANCGLPYYIGGEIKDRTRLNVQTPESLARLLNLNVLTQTEAVGIDRDQKTIRVKNLNTGEESRLAYDKLVLAPGAAPLRPPLPGIDSSKMFTLRTLKDMDRIAEAVERADKILIIGAGFIGLEMAEQLARKKKRVVLAELADQVLPPMDKEMTEAVESELRANGVDLILGDGISGFEERGQRLAAQLNSGQEIEADIVLLSIGVKPESRLAEEAGLTLGARGTIAVNEYQQTSDADIYAAGDAVESHERVMGTKMWLPLGGPANRQGRSIADHIFLGGKAKPYPGHLGTAIVRVFDTSAALTGWTEKRLKQAGVSYGTTTVTDFNHAGYFPGASQLTVKILWAQEDGRLLGAQIVGSDGVDKRIDVLATALVGGLTVDDLCHLELAYAPPFGSARDVVNTAGFSAQNIRNGLIEPARTLSSDATQMLDVRASQLAQAMPIEGAKNIPLEQLRSRLNELDASQPVLTVCSLGKMSYFAARILNQHGYHAASLNGGIRMAKQTEGNSSKQAGGNVPANASTPLPREEQKLEERELDATGLACPGPIVRVKTEVDKMREGEILAVKASDPGFASDIKAFCAANGLECLSVEKSEGVLTARLRKGGKESGAVLTASGKQVERQGATLVVFSADMDRVLASLVIANGSLAMNGKVTLFFTFWGLNVLRKSVLDNPPNKGFMDKMFGWMMPKGIGELPLSRMHFWGMGTAMMKYRMRSKNLPDVQGMLDQARKSGVRLVACSMSMEAMGIREEELIEGVEIGGVADFLGAASKTGVNLFL